jgi:hypothetical protein
MKILLVVALLLVPAAAFAQIPSVTLTWQDNSGIVTPTNCSVTATSCDAETGFELQRNLNGGTFATIGTKTVANVTSVTDATRVAAIGVDNLYCYRVRGFNSAGNSAFSNTACAPVIAALPVPVVVPPAASNLTATVPAAAQKKAK